MSEYDYALGSYYHCSAEWHLIRLRDTNARKAPFAAILYPFAYRISNESGRFYCSAVRIAQHFEVSTWTVLRAMEALTLGGFFEIISKEPFQPTLYHVVPHSDWAKSHPGYCAVKETFPWSDEKDDKLGVRLSNVGGGRIMYAPYMLKALRKTGLNDDEIVERFELFVAQEIKRRQEGGWHGRWKHVHPQFLRHLRGEHTEAGTNQLEVRTA